MECCEFHDLFLLLRSELKETDIPHRHKIRSLIIKAWQAYFAVLQADLAVSVLASLVTITNCFHSEVRG